MEEPLHLRKYGGTQPGTKSISAAESSTDGECSLLIPGEDLHQGNGKATGRKGFAMTVLGGCGRPAPEEARIINHSLQDVPRGPQACGESQLAVPSGETSGPSQLRQMKRDGAPGSVGGMGNF